ncbi:dipeptidase PepV [Lacticaseibacillus zhaodongensis]|uniref:dipeptidase PepV n=1 Tax=Lacticaseibacillus zhaodongensis TaxID=2668065 RepID=UPI0012D325BA|nr:dipeptidase PepV [Lacticaseibacillus zhaodongensis]
MKYDFESAAAAYQDAMVSDLSSLITIDSERDTDHATDTAPLGPGPAMALNSVIAMAERDGFTSKNVENVAARIELGSGSEILGVLGHVDVVPAGDGWVRPPFTPTIEGDRIYGRGTADDKGPVIAAYYALRILRDLNVPLSKQVHLILGTDEESEWYGMHRYMATQPVPDFGFSPDAEFPIINGEKGIVSFLLTQKHVAAAPAAITLLHFRAGIRPNMVPGRATAELQGELPDYLEAQLQAYAKVNHLQAEWQQNGQKTTLTMIGKGAHAMNPGAGKNAATYLADFLSGCALDLDPAGSLYLYTIAHYLHLKTAGEGLGINYSDRKMGPLTAAADIFEFSQDGKQSVLINVRYPQGTSADLIRDQIETAVGEDNYAVSIDGEDETPHYVPDSDPLVQTLLDVYSEHTGLPGKEGIVGGGTYGRMLKRGVAFGAQMPGAPDIMHQADEYIEIKTIVRAAAIYADAISRLAN